MSLLIKGVTKLSGLEIDADKDWAAKQISNLLAAIIRNDGGIQLGTLAGAPKVFGGVAGEPQELFVQPKDGDTFAELGLYPKGASDIAILELSNSPDPLNPGVVHFAISGDEVRIIPVSAGTGVPPNIFKIGFNTVPRTTQDYGLGDDDFWWRHVNAILHNIRSDVGLTYPASGILVNMTAGTALTVGQACAVGGDSKMEKAKADSLLTMPSMALAAESLDEDADGLFLLQGFFYDEAWDWLVKKILYIDPTTAGALTQTLPSTSGHQVQVVGVAITANIIFFSPSLVLCEVT